MQRCSCCVGASFEEGAAGVAAQVVGKAFAFLGFDEVDAEARLGARSARKLRLD